MVSYNLRSLVSMILQFCCVISNTVNTSISHLFISLNISNINRKHLHYLRQRSWLSASSASSKDVGYSISYCCSSIVAPRSCIDNSIARVVVIIIIATRSPGFNKLLTMNDEPRRHCGVYSRLQLRPRR